MQGLSKATAVKLAADLGFTSNVQQEDAADCFMKLYDLFCKYDSTLVEINPMAEDNSGNGACVFVVAECKV